MQYVFVLDKNKKPLDPCHPARARKLLRNGKAAVFRRYPFTIILKDRIQEVSEIHDYRVKIDPGSRTTGMVLVRENDHKVIWAGEIEHRGNLVKKKLLKRKTVRKSRRNRKCRYRPARFLNRVKPLGWIPPSIQSRLSNIRTWVKKIARFSPAMSFSMELNKFDTQKMKNPEISGIEYQQGELQGYEAREYLLEKWERKCAYCGKTGIPLEIEHIIPKSRGGSNSISNLTLACRTCNTQKNNKTALEFGHPEIQIKANMPLNDATAINVMRWELWKIISAFGVPVECGTGGNTKFNRIKQNFPKTHWLDAACVGITGKNIFIAKGISPLQIKSCGHGQRQMCRMDKFGFPRTLPKCAKFVYGFQTGDIVKAIVPRGKNKGTHIGRVVIKARGSFDINVIIKSVNWKNCQLLHKSDGYDYSYRSKREGGNIYHLKQTALISS